MLSSPSPPMEWYECCISQRLGSIASKGKSVLPDALCAEISSTSSRVYAHEARIYELSSVPNSTTDPDFVYAGYSMALAPLIQYMIDPDSRTEMTGIQLQMCTQLLVHLRRILAVLKARGPDSDCITYNTAVNVLVSEIDRVL